MERHTKNRIQMPGWSTHLVPVAVIGLAVFSGACSRTPAGGAQKATPAATVQNPKPESGLTTVTLSPEAEAHLALKTIDVALASVAESRTVGGEAVVPPGRSAVISAPVAGTLFAPGGRGMALGPVKKDTVLLELMPLQPGDRDALSAARRDLQEAEARATQAGQRLRRLEGLLKEGSASQRSVEEARADLAVAGAAATAASARVASMGRVPIGSRGELTLIAPFDGTVTAIHAAAGQTVAAGAPIAEVSQVDALWIRVSLYAGDVAQVDPSRPASVAALDREAAGPWHEARRVSGPPSADPGAASVDLFFDLSSASAIRPGERVAVRLPLRSAATTRAIVIPASAVIYDLSGGTWVYESKGAHVFARRRVELAGPSGASVVVRRGLTEGLRIVTVGAAELYGTEFYVSK